MRGDAVSMVRVYPDEEWQEMMVVGDLIVLINHQLNMAQLYQTVETYQNPSQGIIDKITLAEEDYNYNDETRVFRHLRRVGETDLTAADSIDNLLALVPPL
jgi:hypothetical protein